MLDYYMPLNISRKIPFAPANGKLYTNSDFKRCYSQQPFRLIPTFLWAKNCHEFDPPTLYHGYIIEEDKALAIIRQHFKECIVWTTEEIEEEESEDEEGNEDKEEEEDEEDEEDEEGEGEDEEAEEDDPVNERGERLVPHIMSTFRNQLLSDALVDRFSLPSRCRHMIAIEPFIRKDGKTEWGLSLGSNYTGLVPVSYLPPILEFFGIPATERSLWYLDPLEWRWLPKEC